MPRRKREFTQGDQVSLVREGIKKATSEMMVLFLLRQRPMYAYEMKRQLTQMIGSSLSVNTFHSALVSLQEGGLAAEHKKIVTEGNRLRIYYEITPQGQEYLDQEIKSFRKTTREFDALLKQDGKLLTQEG